MAYISWKKQELKLKVFEAKVVEELENGDAIVELPDELIETLGWKIGDRLDIATEDESVIIKNLDVDNRKMSLDKQ